MSTTIRWRDAALRSLLSGQNGPVGKTLSSRANWILNQVRVNQSGRPGPRVQTGRLRQGNSMRLVEQGGELHAQLGSNVQYARYLEFGTSRMPAYRSWAPALEAAIARGIVKRG